PAARPPASAPAQAPAPARAEPRVADAAGVQTAPVRPSGVETRPLSSPPAAAAAGLRREPRGVKRPYSDAALAELKAADARSPEGGEARAGASGPAAAPSHAGAAGQSGASAGAATTGAAAGQGASAAGASAAGATAAGATAAATGSAGAGSGSTPPEFIWPVPGKVLQSFGEGRSTGLVLAAAAGDPVNAAADGKVIFSGPGPRGYGNLIILKHDGDLLSVYAHGRSLLVKEGQSVRRGQKIAEAGDSGTDKPKLLFEVRRGGKPIDPIGLLPAPAGR
ncbi:MAG: peptidoglycan DD-metalloendopeptidase family protein, partial [Betaproteobacteria bacterium]|nr:peptidoglycan DD-metalloendopeptidase family protein [Betaproteobacteria bacterium]